MEFAGINYLAVLCVAVAAFITGAVWYGVLGKQWMAASGKMQDDIKPTPAPFVIAFIAELIMAYVLAD